jgi:hypothetical protein
MMDALWLLSITHDWCDKNYLCDYKVGGGGMILYSQIVGAFDLVDVLVDFVSSTWWTLFVYFKINAPK